MSKDTQQPCGNILLIILCTNRLAAIRPAFASSSSAIRASRKNERMKCFAKYYAACFDVIAIIQGAGGEEGGGDDGASPPG